VAAHPDNDKYKDDLSFAFGRQSDMLRKVDKTGADDAKRKQNEIAKTARVVYIEDVKQLSDARTHFQKGKKLKEAEQYGDAIKEFESWETSYLRHVRYGSKNDDFEHLYEAYGLIAETQEKLGNVSEQEAALNRSMHAAEIAVAMDPDKDGPRETLLAARFKLVRAHTRNWTTRFDEAALAVTRESVADAESLLARHRQNMEVLTVRGMSRLALGLILRGRKEIGWQEAIRSGVIDEEFVAGKDKQDKDSLKYAGGARVALALDLKEQNKEGEARNELQRALKDYLDASKRDPKDRETLDAIRDIRQALGPIRPGTAGLAPL
jgi:tetratricopeptide (TPR) repeat protein